MKKNSSDCQSPKASMKATRATNVTVGMDLGDKTSRYCMLDENGEVSREASVATTKKAMTQVFATMKPCRVAIEVGTQAACRADQRDHAVTFGSRVEAASGKRRPSSAHKSSPPAFCEDGPKHCGGGFECVRARDPMGLGFDKSGNQ